MNGSTQLEIHGTATRLSYTDPGDGTRKIELVLESTASRHELRFPWANDLASFALVFDDGMIFTGLRIIDRKAETQCEYGRFRVELLHEDGTIGFVDVDGFDHEQFSTNGVSPRV